MGAVGFNDLITFTRSTGGGIFNAQGQYEWLPANTPRIDYDPVTGECKGLLVEEQRTNLLTYSSDLTNAVWSKVDVSIFANAAAAPDATLSAQKIGESSSTAEHFVRYRKSNLSASSGYTFSCFFKKAGRTKVQILLANTMFSPAKTIEIDLASGALRYDQEAVAASLTDMGGGWVRFTVTKTTAPSGADADILIRLLNGAGESSYQGDGTSGIYIWGAQLEAGQLSSYIPTTNAQVTRAADVAVVNELSPWFNPVEGTLVVEFLAPMRTSAATFPGVIGLASAGTSDRLGIYTRTDNGAYAMLDRAGGSVNMDHAISTGFESGMLSKVALSYSAESISGCANGAVASDGTIVLPVVDHLRIGRMDTLYLGSHIKSFRYYPKRLSDAELQALTAQ